MQIIEIPDRPRTVSRRTSLRDMGGIQLLLFHWDLVESREVLWSEVSTFSGKRGNCWLAAWCSLTLLSIEQLLREPFALAIRMHRSLRDFYPLAPVIG